MQGALGPRGVQLHGIHQRYQRSRPLYLTPFSLSPLPCPPTTPTVSSLLPHFSLSTPINSVSTLTWTPDPCHHALLPSPHSLLRTTSQHPPTIPTVSSPLPTPFSLFPTPYALSTNDTNGIVPTPYYLLSTPFSPLPAPCSLLLITQTLNPTWQHWYRLCSLLTTPYSLLPINSPPKP